MTLSSAYNTINSSFASTAAQSAVIARNISNANTPSYSREVANQVASPYGGSEVVSVTREASAALLDQLNVSTSESASQAAVASGLANLAQTVNDSASVTSASGAMQNGASPSAILVNLQGALSTYAASPNSAAAGQAAVTAANQLVGSLNAGASAVSQVRSQADSNIAASVATIDTLLAQFASVNNGIVSGLAGGADVSRLQDSRDSILTQLSTQVGVNTTMNANGSMSIYTDSGVTLFQDGPRAVTFSPTATYVAGSVGAAVTVDGTPITGASAPMAIHSGALAGLTQLRDVIAPRYQQQLDQIAGGLVNAFSESDQSASPTQPTLPGLFTFPGATGVPSSANVMGLSAQIVVNANVDPSRGGNVNLLRDGGVSSPGNPAYTYNPSGGTSFSGRLRQLISGIDATQAFAPSAGLASSDSLSDFASTSVSWLQGQNSAASNAAAYQSSLVSQASSALSNAIGVNLDTEMTNMLNIENSYTTSAKLLTTVNNMFSALINAA